MGKLTVLSNIFLDMKDDVTLCTPCMFGTSRRKQWITKWKESGSVRKYTDNKLGAAVSVDQIQSSHTVLVR